MKDDQFSDLQELFSGTDERLAGDAFTAEVMAQAESLNRKTIVTRFVISLVLGLLAVPVQEVVLPLAEILVHSLVDLDDRLLAQILAPINSVGGALSVALFGLRVMHKKLFS